MKQLVYSANCCFNCYAEQSHKDNVCSTAVEEQLKQRVVQLSEPSSISLLILMFPNCEGQSHKTVSTDHNF